MANLKLLGLKIQQAGLKHKYIAAKLGMAPNTFTDRLHGRSDFKLWEANALARLLGLDAKAFTDIFFDGEGKK